MQERDPVGWPTFYSVSTQFRRSSWYQFSSFVNCSVWAIIGQLGYGPIGRAEIIFIITFMWISSKLNPEMGFAIHTFSLFSCDIN